jgi:hypothetical protein
MDEFAVMLSKANVVGHIRRWSRLILGGVTHLQYVDDTIILIERTDRRIANLKLLICFENMSVLKINFDKIEAILTGVNDQEKCRVANMLNCRLGKLPMKYLGLPNSDKPSGLRIVISSPRWWDTGLTLGRVSYWPQQED